MDELELWNHSIFREVVEKGIHPVDLQDFNQNPKDIKKNVDYLDAGVTHNLQGGYSYCRFGCGIPSHKMGSSELYDGKYIWPEGLSHYVKEHFIRLPEFFIDHIEKNNYKIQFNENNAIEDVTIEKWYEWCQKKRKTQYNDIDWSNIDD